MSEKLSLKNQIFSTNIINLEYIFLLLQSDYRTSIHAAAACGMSEIQMCCSVRFIAV